MQNTIYYIGGSKGGVGKSIITTVLVQFLFDRYGESKAIHLVETDESNPDVGRIYSGKIPVTPLVLDERFAFSAAHTPSISPTCGSSGITPVWKYRELGLVQK
jgi:MinD superfamily P-loop ATPase